MEMDVFEALLEFYFCRLVALSVPKSKVVYVMVIVGCHRKRHRCNARWQVNGYGIRADGVWCFVVSVSNKFIQLVDRLIS